MNSFILWLIVIGVILLLLFIAGAIFMVKAVSMYRQSEKDKKYDEMLKQPLEKMGTSNLNDLEKKYETNTQDNKE